MLKKKPKQIKEVSWKGRRHQCMSAILKLWISIMNELIKIS